MNERGRERRSAGSREPQGFFRRGLRHVAWRAERASTAVVDALRRGERTVILTPAGGMRFGNWLYLWQEAHQKTAAGVPTVIVEQQGMEIWLAEFPGLRALTVAPSDVRFSDRRDRDVRKPNRFGTDFTRETLAAFIRDTIAPQIEADGSGTLVVNVRRGDYYTGQLFQDMFGFDQLGYLHAALDAAGDAERILVVSDDEAWCRDNLAAMVSARSRSVDFLPADPVTNFRAVARSSRIIGTNSTFTYWAAYTAGVVHERPQVIMPSFHARTVNGGRATQLDPLWTAIDGFW